MPPAPVPPTRHDARSTPTCAPISSLMEAQVHATSPRLSWATWGLCILEATFMPNNDETMARAEVTAASKPPAATGAPPAAAISRRGVLAGAAVIASGSGLLRPTAARAAPSVAAGAASAADTPWRHAGGDPRGSDIAVSVGRAREGRFGVMFKKLDSFAPTDDLLTSLAARMGEPTST